MALGQPTNAKISFQSWVKKEPNSSQAHYLLSQAYAELGDLETAQIELAQSLDINPDYLPEVYKRLDQYSSKYVMVAEYYNPSPVMINYRGHDNRLFKRDFAGELMEMYPDLQLVDYGFMYHRDPVFPQDDITWFLMEKG